MGNAQDSSDWMGQGSSIYIGSRKLRDVRTVLRSRPGWHEAAILSCGNAEKFGFKIAARRRDIEAIDFAVLYG